MMLTMWQVDKKLLNTVKETLKQGFSWAAREGPLCEERTSAPFSLAVSVMANTLQRSATPSSESPT